MGKRQRMITDEVFCSTAFLNMHSDTQLLYVFLILFSDDDGIVDPFPVMRMSSITNLSSLEELINREFLYQVDDEGMIYYIVHFRAQNRIPPSKKVDSLHLPALLERYPELIGNITISKNPNYPDSFSQNIPKIRKMETDSKFLPKERKERKNYTEMPDEVREKINKLNQK